ncbi:hypothetical protein PLESTM_001003300 [Pleodorina starrii]|nr:hypothetical protein PLESTM_001003300 [Pleodorina starrii]
MAENAAGAFLRLGTLPVTIRMATIEVPLQRHFKLARPHSHIIVIKGLPGAYTLEGVTGAFLFCAGLADNTTHGRDMVVGEVLGLGPGGLPNAFHLVAFMDAPPSDLTHLTLPPAFKIDQLTVHMTAYDMRDP